ncbi:MAG: hypothetical protein RLZZ299_1676 [Pseudomonadota bacterium]|jgi:hypothetical protein
MASKTAQTTFRRMLRNKNAGKQARRDRANKGTTPAFPLHTAQAEANAAEKAKK